MRSTIYNVYRLPLNVAVLLPLLMNFTITTTFMVTTSILILASVSQFLLMGFRETHNPKKTSEPDVQEIEIMGKETDVSV